MPYLRTIRMSLGQQRLHTMSSEIFTSVGQIMALVERMAELSGRLDRVFELQEVLDDLDFFSEEEARASEDFVLGPDEETATKLELAYAYQKMGDSDGAKEILHEVIAEANESQITEARRLLDSLQATS